MYCKYCGKELADQAVVCLGCGAEVKRDNQLEDTAGAGWWWLGFLVPLAGFLIWITCNDTQPKRAKKAGVGALVGVITSVALVVLFYILWFVLVIALAGGMMYY